MGGKFELAVPSYYRLISHFLVETFEALQERIPERIVEKAIKGMLPHNALGRQMFRKLKVYKGTEHPHAAQKPQPLQLNPSASAQ